MKCILRCCYWERWIFEIFAKSSVNDVVHLCCAWCCLNIWTFNGKWTRSQWVDVICRANFSLLTALNGKFSILTLIPISAFLLFPSILIVHFSSLLNFPLWLALVDFSQVFIVKTLGVKNSLVVVTLECALCCDVDQLNTRLIPSMQMIHTNSAETHRNLTTLRFLLTLIRCRSIETLSSQKTKSERCNTENLFSLTQKWKLTANVRCGTHHIYK